MKLLVVSGREAQWSLQPRPGVALKQVLILQGTKSPSTPKPARSKAPLSPASIRGHTAIGSAHDLCILALEHGILGYCLLL